MARNGKNANYDFSKQKAPATRMGSGNFANLPKEAFVKELSKRCDYRDGIIDSLVNSVEDASGIPENQR